MEILPVEMTLWLKSRINNESDNTAFSVLLTKRFFHVFTFSHWFHFCSVQSTELNKCATHYFLVVRQTILPNKQRICTTVGLFKNTGPRISSSGLKLHSVEDNGNAWNRDAIYQERYLDSYDPCLCLSTPLILNLSNFRLLSKQSAVYQAVYLFK